jgi:hypothetical protein
MKAFKALYRKDIEAGRFTLLLFLALGIGWDAFLLTRTGRWQPELVFGLSGIPFALLPFWIWTEAIQQYRSEWHKGTIYLLLSQPVPGWKQALSKLLALLTGTLALGTASSVGMFLCFWTQPSMRRVFQTLRPSIPPHVWGWAVWMLFVLAFWGLVTTAAVVLIIQASYLLGRLVRRGGFVVMLMGLLGTTWTLIKMGALGHYVLGWLPYFNVPFASGNSMVMTVVRNAVFIETGVIAGLLIGVGLLYALISWLWQSVLEV